MHIGQITQWYDPEGSSAALPGVISRSLASRGNTVDVLTGFPNYPNGEVFSGYRVRPYQRERAANLTIHRAPLWANHDPSSARRAANYLSFAAGASTIGVTRFPRTDANLVHLTPATVALPALAIKLLRRVPYVVHVQDLWPDTVLHSDFLKGGHSRVERALHVMCDLIYRQAASIAVTSPGMIEAIIERGVEPKKIHFVPNWADEKVITGAFEPDAALKEELGLSAPFVVMYAGNFGEYQKVDLLLKAASLLSDQSAIQFAIVGGGVEERRLRDLARGLDNVVFVPPQPFESMGRVLSVGDLHYIALDSMPLFEKTIPSKIQATLAAGRPVVASLSGDARKVLTEAGSTVVAEPTPEAIAAAIRTHASLPERELIRRKNRSRDHYARVFSEEASSRSLINLLSHAARDVCP
ncbi:glycosyltransferase family 4 protein [Flexivirga lutea]